MVRVIERYIILSYENCSLDFQLDTFDKTVPGKTSERLFWQNVGVFLELLKWQYKLLVNQKLSMIYMYKNEYIH